MGTDCGVVELDLNERLHIDIGAWCNNNCLFCMEEDRTGRRERVGRITPKQVEALLRANVHRREVMFVSGEPTLNPMFPSYVKLARDLGYESIGVVSNGRYFSYMPFTRKVVDAGLNFVIVSIHGPDPKVHDGLTRTPGSFAQTLKGLENLSKIRASGLRLNTSTVLNKRNTTVPVIEKLVKLLKPRVDQMVFNVIQPFGRGNTYFDRLVMRYVDTATVLGEFFSLHAGEELPIFLVDIPYCTTEGRGIPDKARGYIERYVHFEPNTGDSNDHQRPKEEMSLLDGGASVKLNRYVTESTAFEPNINLTARHRDLQEKARKRKMKSCLKCVYFDLCDGVWINYLERNGFEEFVPVQRTQISFPSAS